MQAMKILIVKLSSIGDIVHTLPALAAIRRALPEAEISWAVEKRAAEILRHNPFLANLIEVDTKTLRRRNQLGRAVSGFRAQLRELRVSTFDATLDFQGLLKSSAIAKLAKSKRIYGFSKSNLREPASRFLLTDQIEVARKSHIIVKNLELAEQSLGIAVPAENFEFPIATAHRHREEAARVLDKSGENFAILNPATSWQTKLWSADKYGALADKLWEEQGLTSVVTSAPDEIDLAEEVLRNSKCGRVSLAQPSLKGFYELAKKAKIYVGGDTAPTHLATAANAPIVGIFGPTEWRRNGSPNKNDVCVERDDIGCRVDCHRRICDNWICMDIKVAAVLDAVRKRLESAARVFESC